jgi:membrane-associated phospholipid phosphatase
VATIAVLGGLRGDHVFIGALGLLDVYNENTRRFVRAFFPFILTGTIYDATRYVYQAGIAGRVHVAEPYLLERAWFSVGGRTLNEIFFEHHWAVADLAAGFAYLTYVGEYLALAFYAFWRCRGQVARTLARGFLVVNVMGFITYFAYPAAPPWYVTKYGFGPAQADIPADPAAARRFDELLGTHFFDAMYGRSIDVFGAFPSLHVAYPLIAALVALRAPELRVARLPTAAFFGLICFSAVYLQHHYVIDVLLGIVYAAVAIAAVWRFERREAAREAT